MKCCGKLRTSKFCPDCGKLLAESHSLVTLLRHCEQQAISQEKALKTAGKKLGQGPDDQRWFEDYSKCKQEAIDKWRLWATLLRKLIESSAA